MTPEPTAKMKLMTLVLGLVTSQLSTGLVLPRRSFLMGVPCLAGISSFVPVQAASAAVLQVERCDSGIGSGCAADADTVPPFIRDLREKSAANKPRRDAEDLKRYNENNFGDFFAASYPPRKLVIYPTTGKFEALTEPELKNAIVEGRVKIGSMGQFQDNYATRMPYYFVE